MASAGTHSMNGVTVILKEGYLATETKHSLRPPTRRKYWTVLEQEQDTVLACYKDETKTKLLKEKSQIKNVEVDKQKHGNYLCITCGKHVTHLRAESRHQRDEWYSAIKGALGRLCVAEFPDDCQIRQRSNTDQVHLRPPCTRDRQPGGVQTSMGLQHTFVKELKESICLPLPKVEDDDDVCKILTRPLYCCIRNHVVSLSKAGTSMADENTIYENIHFVRSREAWTADVESRMNTLGATAELYKDLHQVTGLSDPADVPIYETNLPEENDDRDYPVPRAKPAIPNKPNNLSQPAHDRQVNFDPNVTSDCDSERNSLSSIEDNTQVQTDRQPPLVPLCTGEQHRKKIQQLKEDQRQPHGIIKTFRKTSLVGDRFKIILMEKKDGIWVIGLDPRETQLRGALRVGDQVIKINRQALTSASYAMDTIRSTDDNEVTMMLKRIPHGTVSTINRQSEHDDLGLQLEGNEIINVDPHGLASTKGDLKPQTTGVTGRMCNWAITEINTRPVDLFASADDIMKLFRQAKKEVSLIVQPVDFIQMMRDEFRTDSSLVMKSWL